MITRRTVAAACVVLALAFGVARNPAAQGAAPPQQPSMQDMTKMHAQMMAEMKAGDARLDALVKEMNAATGDAKVGAVAAVVNELVQQHKTMHGRMGQMHEHMMGMGGMMMRR
jgi:hypothetical protein